MNKLYVGNLPFSLTEEQLEKLFAEKGKVVSVAMPIDRETGRKRGFAFVEMESKEDAEAAIQHFNGETIDILANNNGDFTTAVTLNEGENEIMSYSKDTAGNKSATTDTFVITYDKTAPNLDITKPQDQATFYGSKERQLLIQGKTDEKTRVSVNGRHVVVESNGSFTFLTTLSEGENKFTIKAEDEASNITEKTLTVTYSP
jgi:RNA recognition motif-containing protein